ncbi:MAG: hypothetical protein KIS78_27550 [Labilithrix sp.]|nr:hypothetical protein [Labilithrix sp.]
MSSMPAMFRHFDRGAETGSASAEEAPEATLARLWLHLDAARSALARARPPAILQTASELLNALGSARVRSELVLAATAFAEGLDERPDAEQWVFFAVAARATLDRAEKSGARAIAAELERLDESFEDAREAVLLLEPEDYKEALTATPPNTGAWWGERARLDAGLREIDLERALGDLAAG